MNEHSTWLDFLPGYHRLELFLKQYLGRSWSNSVFPPQKHFSFTHVVFALSVFFLLIAFGVVFRRRALKTESIVPSSKLSPFSFFDFIFEWIYDLIKDTVEDKNDIDTIFPLAAGIFIFILFSNMIGLIPGVDPPTVHLQFNFSVALVVFVLTHYFGIKRHGFSYLKQFFGEVWYMAPLFFVLEIISHLARPLSLTVRLLGNMFADHKIITIFVLIFPLILPLPFMLLGLFVAFLQAAVFMVLTIIYFSLALSDEH